MRYYDITISKTAGGPPVNLQASGPNGNPLPGAPVQSTARWTSHPNGVQRPPNPAALDVEFDIYVTPYGLVDANAGASLVRIWGIDLPTLKTAVQFSGNRRANPPIPPMFISVKGGMGKGLPLANPAQAGPLCAGQVWQATGNWQGTEQTLDLTMNPAGSSFARDVNLILNWRRRQPLAHALQICLATAFPDAQLVINISPNLIAPGDRVHYAGSLRELGQFLADNTKDMLGNGSLGVQIFALGTTIKVLDGTTVPKPKPLSFFDFIGQPTWIDTAALQFMCPMRADLQVGDTVTMPPQVTQNATLTLQSAASNPQFRRDDTLQGSFTIISARHTARFRNPDGMQWSSTFNCITPISTP
jgi:hypothetical protein